MSRIFLAVCLLCASLDSALAAEVRLGPETALTPVGALGPAANAQTAPAVASNGQDFVAIWRDYRRSRWAGSDIYGTRIDRDGHAFEPSGRRIAEGASNPLIASAGSDYLVVYASSTGVMSQRLDQDGTPLGTAQLLAGNTSSPRLLVSNGTNYLLVVLKNATDSSPELATAMLLDRDGALLRTVWTGLGNPIAARANGGNYIFLEYSLVLTLAKPLLHIVSDAGTVTSSSLANILLSSSTVLAAAFSPDKILFTWTNQWNELQFQVAGYNGAIIRTTAIIDTQVSSQSLVASWNGSEFNVAYGQGTSDLDVVRITADGFLADVSRPVLTSHRAGFNPAFASAGAMQIVVWPDRRQDDGDILARTFTSFDSLGAAPDQGNLISWSGVGQSLVKVARSGDHEIAVWVDSSNHVLASVNGPAILIGVLGQVPDSLYLVSPSVAASDSNFLVVWYDKTKRVLGTRVAFDGNVLDTPPIVLSTDSAAPPSIASDGSTYLVSWSANPVLSANSVITVRVANDGAILGRSAFAFEVNYCAPVSPRLPQVVWTGTRFFLGYTLLKFSCNPYNTFVEISGAPLDTRQPSSTARLIQLPYSQYDSIPVSFASGGEKVAFAWAEAIYPRGYRIAAAMTSVDGTWTAEPRTVFQDTGSLYDFCGYTPAIAWDGAEFVIAWTDCATTLHAVRLNQSGNPIEEPFDVATGAPPAVMGPSIVPTADGVIIIYTRPDAANGDGLRAFKRSLARLPPPRRRSAGH